MSCPSTLPIPSPPTALSSCAVPIGGSNSSILDTCCNGHINAIATYAAPGSSNARSDAGCFQFCVTDTPEYVEGCLTNTLGEFEKGELGFQCFNVGSVKKGREDSAYGSTGVRGRVGWGMGVLVWVGVMGAVVGSL